MLSEVLYEDKDVKWIVFARDPDKAASVIDTNEYLLISGEQGMLLDPGGVEIFPEVVSAISDYIPLENITTLFGSHQDPDIISSLSLWLGTCPRARVYVPWVWSSFIPHFGCDTSQLVPVPDEGMRVEVSPTHAVELVPAHYLHSSGNLHVYDPKAKILFSGDVGAALLPPDKQDLYVEDFDAHARYMDGFHRRWMPSEAARDAWIERVSHLDIELMVPQHGAIFRRKEAKRFLDWFGGLRLASALQGSKRSDRAA